MQSALRQCASPEWYQVQKKAHPQSAVTGFMVCIFWTQKSFFLVVAQDTYTRNKIHRTFEVTHSPKYRTDDVISGYKWYTDYADCKVCNRL